MTRALVPLVLAAFLLPAALADHVFSHRVVVTGRVVDVEGLPAPGLQPVVRIVGTEVGGPCFDSRDERTGPHGDFELCRHAHDLAAGARVNVTVGDASLEVPLDKDLRKASVLLQLTGAHTMRDLEADRTFPTLFRVEGRALRYVPEPENVEGVRVDAVPMGVNVTVVLGTPNATLAMAIAGHDEHGDYAVDLPVADVPADASATASAGTASWSVPASALYRRADVHLVQAIPEPDTPVNQVGTSPAPLAGWVGLAAFALAALALRRRA